MWTTQNRNEITSLIWKLKTVIEPWETKMYHVDFFFFFFFSFFIFYCRCRAPIASLDCMEEFSGTGGQLEFGIYLLFCFFDIFWKYRWTFLSQIEFNWIFCNLVASPFRYQYGWWMWWWFEMLPVNFSSMISILIVFSFKIVKSTKRNFFRCLSIYLFGSWIFSCKRDFVVVALALISCLFNFQQ